MKEIEQGVSDYNLGKIDMNELTDIFLTNAIDEQIKEYWKIPLWDRPLFVLGESEEERNAEWNSIIKNKTCQN